MLPEDLARAAFGGGPTALEALAASLVAAGLFGAFMLANAAVAGPWGKRKVMSAFGDKVGPNRHGPAGLLIVAADGLRLLSKELIVPESVDRPAWDLAPAVLLWSALVGFAALPLGSLGGVDLQLADPETGIAFVLAASSLSTVGIVMGGYASNNKFSLLGALRAIAASIAYEVPLAVTAASVVLLVGSLRTSEIVAAQSVAAGAEPLLTVGPLAVPPWFAFVNPLAFGLFVVATLAEVGRNPFDLAEAPTEIVAGYQTEYGGVYFMLFYVGEFVHVFLAGGVTATLFLGGPAGPWLPGFVWFAAKTWGVFLFTQWARSAIPRIRIDQLMDVGWKGMLVLAFGNLLLTALLAPLVW